MSNAIPMDRPLTDTQRSLAASCWPMALSIARKNTTAGEDAHEILDGAISGLIRAAQTYDPAKGAFSTHAHWAISGRVRDARLRAATRNRRFRRADSLETVPDRHHDDEPCLEGRLSAALAALGPRHREVFERAVFGGERLEDVGRSFGIGKSMAGHIVKAAKAVLRGTLAQYSEAS